MENWVPVFDTEKMYKAEMVKEFLEENNIDAVIFNQKDSSYNLFGEIHVMVNKEDKDKAEEVINKMDCE